MNEMTTKKTILCVDDEADIIELFQEELEDQGYDVIKAFNGVEAFHLYEEHKIDCIVSDIRMPEGDGIGLVKNVKATGTDIPIFLVTGYSDYSADELSKLGVNAIIFKPFDLEEVVDIINKSLS